MIELIVSSSQLTLLEGDKNYLSRPLGDTDTTRLSGFAASYAALAPKENNWDALLALGRELYGWLDGEQRVLAQALEQCQPPVILEVRCSSRKPGVPETAVLDAPWEILADLNGFLAEDVGLGFSPVRRVQAHNSVAVPDDYRLGLVFMAASPRGVDMLDYEAEEAAIINAVGEQRIDLVVEESGELDELGHKWGHLKSMTALHLSCHGNNKPEPFLALENDTGGCKPAKASDLIVKFRSTAPRLLFLSACLTAAQPGNTETGPAQSLAAALARAGLPAVIGWDGSVGDGAATLFAKKLYEALSDWQPLEDAVFAARFHLLQHTDLKRNDWHLARLWLGAAGGGVLVGGTTERSLLSATHGQREFLDKKQQVPVASHEMFVGRRRELKEGLRVLGAGDKAGLLLLGMGRLGKSSLAARLANRRPDLALAVVHGSFGGSQAILQALAEALGESEQARQIIKASEAQVARNPSSLQEVMQRLLCGEAAPCSKAKPVLLVIDDLEQILEASGTDTDPHRVTPEYSTVLEAVLRAFDPRLTKSRLLFTSRYAFGLGGLETKLHTIQLAAFKPEEQQKLLLHQRNAYSVDEAEANARAALVNRALGVSLGNPGLQDLLVGKFALPVEVPAQRAESVLDQIEAYLAKGTQPTEEEPRQFMEALDLDALLDLAGRTGKAFLRAATVFRVPVPETIMVALANSVGGNVAHLRGLGLLEPHEDFVVPSTTALAVNALAATRLDPLNEAEAKDIAQIVVEPLYDTWIEANRIQEVKDVDIELLRISIMSRNFRITNECGGKGVAAIASKFGNAKASSVAIKSISLCDQHGVKHDIMLLNEAIRSLMAIGEITETQRVLSLLEERIINYDEYGSNLSVGDLIVFFTNTSIVYKNCGMIDAAKDILHCLLEIVERASLAREKAIVLGRLADIYHDQCQYDRALEIRLKHELPLYVSIKDMRSEAITHGKIADILTLHGEPERALAVLNEKSLPAFRKLKDCKSEAITYGKIANILKSQGHVDEALQILTKQLQLVTKMNEVGEVASINIYIADICFQRGDTKEAMHILTMTSLPIYTKLNDLQGIAVTQGRIADILHHKGEYAKAMNIRTKIQLPIYKKIGDKRGIANVFGKIADIMQARGKFTAAMAIRHKKELKIYQEINDKFSEAVCWGKIADIKQTKEQIDEAMAIHQEKELPIFEMLENERETSITLGKIANIMQRRGEIEEALKLHERRLEITKRIKYPNGVAAALWDIARIEFAQGNTDAAFLNSEEAYKISMAIGNAQAVTAIGPFYGQQLVIKGFHEDGLTVLRNCIENNRRLGKEQAAQQVEALLTDAQKLVEYLKKGKRHDRSGIMRSRSRRR